MPDPLRVAIDATSLYTPRTGVGRVAWELLDAVGRRSDVDARAFAVTWRGRQELGSMLPTGVRAVSRAPMAAAPLRALWERADHPRIELWTGPVDVVHGPNYLVPPARAVQVVSVWDLTPWRWPELCTADAQRFPALVDRALRRGAWVHTASAYVRNEILELPGAHPDRVRVVPIGATPLRPAAGDASRRDDDQAVVGPEVSAELAHRFVLALGTVEPRKDLPTLVAAFDALAEDDPELLLVVAGPDGWGVDAFRASVDAARHGDRVRRVGFVTEAERVALLEAAAVVAVPSRYEGFGLPAVEAMLAGTPVVTSDGGSLPEVVGDAGLVVPVGDTSALADALARVLADEALATRLAAAGQERVGAYRWDRYADGMVDLWRAAR